ncbi:MAG TPA: hypothetical protein VFD47_07555 [Actinomycetota bacterium]|nr:hypothetical protein [Actinomycetota bacterium]
MTKCRAQIIWQEMENKVTNPTFRHPSRTIAALFLALGLLLAGSPVAEARDAPKQTGPLNFDQRECGRQKFRTRVNGRLELVAKTETCLLLYNYDPLSEDNEERDYAIAWVQARIEPRGAWCAKKVWSDLGISQDTKFHKRIPARKFSMKKSRRVLVKLATMANGFGEEKASLSERTWFHPRQVRHSRSTVGRSRIFTQRWTGQRGRPLNLTSGAEISWDVDNLPNTIASGLRYDFERRGRC